MSSPSLNLLLDPWFPVRRASGARGLARVVDLAAAEPDPIVAFDWPRPDFEIASYEFVIGLFSTLLPPATHRDWRRWWNAPPAPEDIAERLAPFANAFVFDGGGPRFLQDFNDLGDEVSPIAGLLIEQPGANTEKNNTDLFQKRGRVRVLARSSAAMALFTLQTFAPTGGAGHRTGLRGGGPLTTLVAPPDDGEVSLWRQIWMNVLPALPASEREEPIADAPERTFPWLGSTRVSDKDGVATYAKDIHPAQCFWGMPRRIRLRFEDNVDRLPCDLTGRVEDVIVRDYVTRPYGVNYQGIEHPLTPSYRVKAGAEWLPVHPQPGGIAWRHWPGFVQKTGDDGGRQAKPARVVEVAEARLADLGLDRGRLRLAGFDMDNMKARAFVETETPIFAFGVEDAALRGDFEKLVDRLVASTVETVSILRGALLTARGRDGGSGLDRIQEAFWQETDAPFWEALDRGAEMVRAGEEFASLLRDRWLSGVLRPKAFATFDREVPVEALAASAEVDGLRRAIEARRNLAGSLQGWGPAGARLWRSIGLEPPVADAEKRKKKGAVR